MKKKLSLILVLMLVLSLTLVFAGCETKFEDKEVGIKDYFTEVRISYDDKIDGTVESKIITGEDAKKEFDRMIDGKSKLKNKKITILTFVIPSSAEFNNITIKYSGATSVTANAYYYNDAVITYPDNFESFSPEEKFQFKQTNCRKDISTTVTSDTITLTSDISLKPASAEGTSAYITIALNYEEEGITITDMDGKIIEKVQPLGSKVLSSLELMGYGMLSIFVVIILIIITVVILNKVTAKREKKIDNENNNQ